MTPRREPKSRTGPSTEERAARNQTIRLEINRGHSFGAVAARHSLSERQVRNIWDERKQLAYADPGEDPRRTIQDEVDFLDALMAECAERGELTANDSIWLGSVKTRLAIREQRIELMRLYGLLPHGYDQVEQQGRMNQLIDHLVAILTQHNVPQRVFDDINALAQRDEEAAERELKRPVLRAANKEPTV